MMAVINIIGVIIAIWWSYEVVKIKALGTKYEDD